MGEGLALFRRAFKGYGLALREQSTASFERADMMDLKFQDLSRHRVAPGSRGRPAVVCQLWWIVQATLFRCTPTVMNGWRIFLLRAFGAKIGKGVRIRASARILFPWKLTIGDYSWIGNGADINNWAPLHIGRSVCISQHAFISTGSHSIWTPGFDIVEGPIRIEDEVWIAVRAIVMPGVTLRRGTILSVGSVAHKSTKENTIYLGNPAVPVAERPSP